MADGNIKIAVESVIHDGLRAAVQRICNEHGIRVTSLRVDWLNQTFCEPQFSVVRIKVETESGDR